MINILLVIYAASFQIQALHGTMWSVIGLARLLAETPGGMLVDRIGCKPVIVGGFAVIMVAYIRYASAQTATDILLASFLAGTGFALSAIGLMVQATYYIPQTERVRYMGILNGSMMASNIVGPTMGSILAEYYDLRIPFIASTLTIIIALVIILRLRAPQHDEQSTNNGRGLLQEYRMYMKNKLYLSLFFVSFLYSLIGWGLRSIVFPTYGKDVLALTIAQIGFLSSITSTVLFLEQVFLSGILERKINRRLLVTLGLLIYAGAVYAFSTFLDFYNLAITSAILGMGLGIITPSLEAIWIDITKIEDRGRVYGLRIAFFDVGQIFWSMMIISIANVHPQLPFYTITSVTLVIAFLLARVFKKTQ
jgi:MFS family permease